MASIYDIEVNAPGNRTVSLSEYRGKTMLIVNTATKCGLAPQFDALEALHVKYADKGLAVLGFPCNQFANQEPTADEDMGAVCKMNFGVTFPLFSKIDVNGENESPLYAFLKSEKGGLFGDAIKWNFTKFLVDSEGNVVKRYAPTTTPESMEKDIVKTLGI